MKKIIVFVCLLSVLVSVQAQAAECKVDKVTLTRIQTMIPAGGLDEFSTGAIRDIFLSACTSALFCSGVVTLVKAGNYAFSDKYAIPGVTDTLDTFINDNQFGSGTDELMVRINGVKVVPVSYSDKFYPMERSNVYPAQVSGSTLGTATVQLLEYDSGSDNDDLGSFEVRDESSVFNSLPPVNEDTLFVNATNDEDGSVYIVGYKLEPNEGALDDVPERIICGRDECVDAREPMPKTLAVSERFTGYEVLDCPAGYDFVGFTSEEIYTLTPNEVFAVCELHPDIVTQANESVCGAVYEPLTDINDLNDGDVITMKSDQLINGSGGQYQSSFYGQYLALCPDCFLAPAPDFRYLTPEAAFVHVLDPNRAAANWVVKKLPDGKIALRGDNGKYLSGCQNCGGTTGINAFVDVIDPTINPLAQFNFENTGSGFKLKIGDTFSLTPLPLALEGEGDIDFIGYRYAASFPIVPAPGNDAVWQVSVRQPDEVRVSASVRAGGDAGATNFAFDGDINVQSNETWEVAANQVMTINAGATFTLENGAKIINEGVIINNGFLKIGEFSEISNLGLIINNEAIRIRDGVINNGCESCSAKGVIDNRSANYLQNFGTINNEGYIYDPFNRLSGIIPKIRPASAGYYLADGLFGDRACRLISGNDNSWDAGASACVIDSFWLTSGQTLEIDTGVTLVVNGVLFNEGTILNDGFINNTNGAVRQCGIYAPDSAGTIADLDRLQVCVISVEQTKCEAYNGTFLPGIEANTGTCNGASVSNVAEDDVLTIPSGVTWNVSVGFSNSGLINIEQGGALAVAGGIFTNLGDVINYGEFTVGFDESFAVPFTFQNDDRVFNFGTINNFGDVVGVGSVFNYCGASYNLIHQSEFDPWITPYAPEGEFHDITFSLCTPPDSDGDGVTDDLDAFAGDITQSEDRDGDGFGDNLNGNLPDLFPDNPFEYADSDGDCQTLPPATDPALAGQGCGDNSDAFPENILERADSDGDCGYRKPDPRALEISSGNGCGDISDAFPENPLEISDTDFDCGVIIEQTSDSGNGCADSSDAFVNDSTQTRDTDGDGFGDNPEGNSPDLFIHDPEDARSISVDSANGWEIGSALFSSAARGDVIPAGLPTGVELPYGIMKVLLVGGTTGTESTITVTYPEPLDTETLWWKYGPTTLNPERHWYVFDGAVISGNTVTLSITDGGVGDDDLIPNGKISDPGGPGILPAEEPVDDTSGVGSEAGSSGGGAVNTWMLLLLFSLYLVLADSTYKIRAFKRF